MRRPAVTILQHIACETPGTIQCALASHQLSSICVRPFAGEPVPTEIGESAGLIIMGGPMGVYEQDRYPHLRQEIRLIESALKADRPILGICLGSQLLAATLGAPVTQGPQKELGWYPIHLTPVAQTDPLLSAAPEQIMAFHWHGDIFPLPAGAVHLASSEMTAVQAFRYGANAYGFLCHLEAEEALAATMITTFKDELAATDQDPDMLLAATKLYAPKLQHTAAPIWNAWANSLEGGPQPADRSGAAQKPASISPVGQDFSPAI